MQYMSAGTGVTHSEFNHSREEVVHLLQIWIMPNERAAKPRYGQKDFAEALSSERLCLLASPDGRDGSIAIRQDARVHAARTRAARAFSIDLGAGRSAWLQVARGSIQVNRQALLQGDGMAAEKERKLEIATEKDAEFLLFDLP
jgi:redox-sensitive bicupin YhaK (pirin superfamily)